MAGQTGEVVGYARVSATDQNLARQRTALADVDRLFEEQQSGKSRERPVLAEALAYVRAGDVFRVKSPDRLARSAVDLLTIMDELNDKGVAVEFVDAPALNTDTPQGRFMLTILAAVAEFERGVIRERQAEGIAEAKKRGVYKGRARSLTPEQVAEAQQQVAGGVPKARVARDFGVSRQTLYDALEARGVYADPS